MDILIMLAFSIVAAIVPTVIYVGIAYWLDRYEREPKWLLAITFLWGAVPAIILALIAQLLLDIPIQALTNPREAETILGAVVAPITEEFIKGIPLLAIFFLFRREFDGLMDGLIYGSLVGFGFAMTENILYFLGAWAEGGFVSFGILFILRSIVFGLNHALFTSAFGVGLGFARYSKRPGVRLFAPALGLLGAILLHAIHNFFVDALDGLGCFISLGSDWFGVGMWLLIVYFSLRQEKRWIQEELSEEVANGVLPVGHAAAAASYRERVRERARVVTQRGAGASALVNRLHALAVELAFKKRQLEIHGEERGNSRLIADLRAQIQQLVVQVG